MLKTAVNILVDGRVPDLCCKGKPAIVVVCGGRGNAGGCSGCLGGQQQDR